MAANRNWGLITSGETFEALAIIKYHELRNDRVLVLCPKRLRDNWTLHTANDRRNALASDRFNYDYPLRELIEVAAGARRLRLPHLRLYLQS